MGYALKEFDYSIYFDYTGCVYPTWTLVLGLFPRMYLVINQLTAEPRCVEFIILPRLAVQQRVVPCFCVWCDWPQHPWDGEKTEGREEGSWTETMTIQQGKQMLLPPAKHEEDFSHCCPTAGGCSGASWKARAPHRFLGKMNTITTSVLGSSSSSWAVTAAVCGVEYPSGQFGSATLAVSPLNPLPTPRGRSEKAPMLCREGSAAAKTPVCHLRCSRHKPYGLRRGKWIPSRPDPVWCDECPRSR